VFIGPNGTKKLRSVYAGKSLADIHRLFAVNGFGSKKSSNFFSFIKILKINCLKQSKTTS